VLANNKSVGSLPARLPGDPPSHLPYCVSFSSQRRLPEPWRAPLCTTINLQASLPPPHSLAWQQTAELSMGSTPLVSSTLKVASAGSPRLLERSLADLLALLDSPIVSVGCGGGLALHRGLRCARARQEQPRMGVAPPWCCTCSAADCPAHRQAPPVQPAAATDAQIILTDLQGVAA